MKCCNKLYLKDCSSVVMPIFIMGRKREMLVSQNIAILADRVVCVLLSKAKAVIWKFLKLKTDKSSFVSRSLFIFLSLSIWSWKFKTHVCLILTLRCHLLNGSYVILFPYRTTVGSLLLSTSEFTASLWSHTKCFIYIYIYISFLCILWHCF